MKRGEGYHTTRTWMKQFEALDGVTAMKKTHLAHLLALPTTDILVVVDIVHRSTMICRRHPWFPSSSVQWLAAKMPAQDCACSLTFQGRVLGILSSYSSIEMDLQ